MNSTEPASIEAPSPAARERARALALAELAAAGPVRLGWRARALRLVATLLVFIVAATVAGGFMGLFESQRLWVQAPSWLLLVLAAGLGTWASVAPRWKGAGLLAVLVALAAGVTLVLRRLGLPEELASNPGWVCSTSHLAVGLIPLTLGVLAMRRAAWKLERALVAGIALGTPGGILGELVCQRGWRHALTHHVGAWVLVVAVCVVVSRWVRPRSFAP